jgi:hypothetical protein
MRLTSASVRFLRWVDTIPVVDLFRARAMDRDEMRRRAAAVWRGIDGGDDVPERETNAKAMRLFYLGRDVQEDSLRKQAHIVHEIVKYVMAIIARSYGIGVGAR